MIKKVSNIKNNKKGLTLIELILYLAIVAMITPMLISLFVFGYNSYKTSFNYVDQQRIINDAMQHLRKDIEQAETVSSPNSSQLVLDYFPSGQKIWQFSGSALMLGTDKIVVGIDVLKSKFTVLDQRLILTIKTDETNKTINKNRNVTESIITEFSVKYKQ